MQKQIKKVHVFCGTVYIRSNSSVVNWVRSDHDYNPHNTYTVDGRCASPKCRRIAETYKNTEVLTERQRDGETDEETVVESCRRPAPRPMTNCG